ncbi:MAG TPA: DUF2207 domain-containing protein, partial [Kiloniellales bacterium]|nr:DUF2207 domain-containing protein [Kiloniellales bacterium]
MPLPFRLARLRLRPLIGLGLLVAGLLAAGPAAAQAERILAFRSHVTVHPDSSLTVTETIAVEATGREIKRGIVRDFPTRYRDRFGGFVRVGFQILGIRRDGASEPYHTEATREGVRIFIGRSDVFLKRGRYTYEIRYRTDRQLGFFEDYDELYWNVTGNEWTF